MYIGKNKVFYESPLYLFQEENEERGHSDFSTLNPDFYRILRSNRFYIKRDDLIPYCFGGNKARMVLKYFEDIDALGSDAVVTYGGSDSNLCRIISNLACQRGLPCTIITPSEISHPTFNAKMASYFGASVVSCSVDKVHEAIGHTLKALQDKGLHPYFISGGGHGPVGTDACAECYDEIWSYEQKNHLGFDYIFLASGTGTTQSGLIAGQMLHKNNAKIVGISIARTNPRGRNIICEAVQDYFSYKEIKPFATWEELCKEIQKRTIFVDEYAGEGYGQGTEDIKDVILLVLKQYGIPLDQTYTGKAFCGMLKYIAAKEISGKNILFLHTGGTPLYFDFLNDMS